MIIGAGKSEICRESWQSGEQATINYILSPKANWRQNSFFPWEISVFLLRSLIDWMGPTYIMEE